MHILVDLQSLQTTSSRHRGIGRYSLALFRAMVQAGRDIRFSALFNSAFPAEFEEAKRWIDDILPSDRIFLFDTPGNTARFFPNNAWRATAAAALLESRAKKIAPDFVHVASLFEDFTDDSVTTIGRDGTGWCTTIYDLIPWYQRDVYLENPSVRRCYMAKLDLARHAELLFAISESARQEAIETLQQPPERVINILGDVDEHFRKMPVPEARRNSLLHGLGIRTDFVMYTAGIDFRKNIEGLIEAYATLPQSLRSRHQLVVVCKITEDQRDRLIRLGKRRGLAPHELVCTGFVTDDELADLYRLCRLFVFPSIHEGFGMPILEAMRCGAPVIGSNCSSMPEILGISDAQFDPRSTTSIGAKIAQALQDPGFLVMLRENADIQQGRFSWGESARRVLDGFEAEYTRRATARRPTCLVRSTKRPRLAIVTPLPPEQSGIADYSAELIPALSSFYDITLVTDLPLVEHPWLHDVYPTCSMRRFDEYAHSFDRILYQIGNSSFHIESLRLLRTHPGVVVLHDFFLSNLFDFIDSSGQKPGIFRRELYRSHGYGALTRLRQETFPGMESPEEAAVWKFPCSRLVFEQSYGTIVHSTFSVSAARTYFGVEGNDVLRQIAQLRTTPRRSARSAARAALQIPIDAVLVCSFGVVGPTKLNKELVKAWCTSELAKRPNHFLRFLGTTTGSPYESELHDLIATFGAQNQVLLMGFADSTTFQRHLEAADCAVQLRTHSRGETSRAVLDCLAFGLPVIVNHHGTLAELPIETAMQVPDHFGDQELASAIVTMLDDPIERERRVEHGLAFISKKCDATTIAQDYFDAIESFYASNPNSQLDRFLTDLIRMPSPRPEAGDAERVAAVAEKIMRLPRTPYCFLDITCCLHRPSDEHFRSQTVAWISGLLALDLPRMRVETIYWDGSTYRFARSQTPALLGIDRFEADDDVIDVQAEDHFVGLGQDVSLVSGGAAWLRKHRLDGLRVYFVLLSDDRMSGRASVDRVCLSAAAMVADGIIATSNALIDEASRALHCVAPCSLDPLPFYRTTSLKRPSIEGAEGSVATLSSQQPSLETLIQDLITTPETLSPALVWHAKTGFAIGIEDIESRTQTGHVDQGALHHSARKGLFVFGPSRSVARGHYALQVYGRFEIDDASDAWISVVSRDEAIVHWHCTLRTAADPRFEFAIEHDAIDAEIRIQLDARDLASVTGYHVHLLERVASLDPLAA